jgi:hypothetical protein
MPLKKIDYGIVGDVNTVVWVEDDNIGPSDRTDAFVVGKAITLPHTVDYFVTCLPPGPPVSIDAPGPDLASAVGITLAAGQEEENHFLVQNDATGGIPAAYMLIVTLFVDGVFSGVFPFPVP